MDTPIKTSELKAARRKLYVKTFGCQMNEYDSEKIKALLSEDYCNVDNPEDADLIFVNTCSVREKGEHKLFSVLGKYRDLKNKRPELLLGVGGCVAQQEGTSIIKRNSAVDFVVGTQNLSLVPSLVRHAKSGLRRQVAVDYREEWEDLPDAYLPLEDDSSADSNSAFGNPKALVSIQRGCNKHCSFCVVPTTRGPETSRSAEEIEREVRLKVRLGAKEVVLLGQTVNSYGRDLTPRFPFHKLIERLAEIDGLKRIRFTSPHPADVRPEFIELYAEFPQLCRHIHLPLQSGNDRILKLMNRNYRRARYLEIVDSLRQACPEIAISSDIIVGFPTETDRDFQDTLDLMQEVQFHISYSFKYSVRPNTTAKTDFSQEQLVPENVAKERLSTLQAVQDELSYKINKRIVGQTREVLVEGEGMQVSSNPRGRIPENTLCEIIGQNPKIGDIVNVRIEHASPYGLRGAIVENSNG